MTSPVRPRSAASQAAVQRYAPLIAAFLDGRLTAAECETRYLEAFGEDRGGWPPDVYDDLNEAFLDVDAYWHEPDDDPLSIDEPELRRRMTATLAAMQAA